MLIYYTPKYEILQIKKILLFLTKNLWYTKSCLKIYSRDPHVSFCGK